MVRRIRKTRYKRRKKRQRGSFLNRYNFAFAGRDVVNTAIKGLDAIAPKITKQVINQVDQIA